MRTLSFSLAFYIVLRPQGIRKQMKTLRKRHCVHIATVQRSAWVNKIMFAQALRGIVVVLF